MLTFVAVDPHTGQLSNVARTAMTVKQMSDMIDLLKDSLARYVTDMQAVAKDSAGKAVTSSTPARSKPIRRAKQLPGAAPAQNEVR